MYRSIVRVIQPLVPSSQTSNFVKIASRSISSNNSQKTGRKNGLNSLLGKIALVTGGSSGIGLATAKELLRCGVERVCLADLNEQQGCKVLREIGREYGRHRAMFVVTDVRYPTQIQGAFEATLAEWKQIDIVVNNAGIMDEVNWQDQIETNVTAVVKGSMLAHEYMSKANNGNGGTVINVSSIYGVETFSPFPVFAGTEHFIVGYTRSLGMPFNFNTSGVRVMALCPGVTNTTMINEYHNLVSSVDHYQEAQRIISNTPFQAPEIVGRGIIHMLQNGGTGSIWVCEGGLSPYELAFPDRHKLRKRESSKDSHSDGEMQSIGTKSKSDKETVLRFANQIEELLKVY